MAVASIKETRTYLTFKLGEETFALDVGQVKEVLDFSPITRVPGTPGFMRGVINLRGSVVPVVDLRTKLKIETHHGDDVCYIIVLELRYEGAATLIGALTDSVQEVFELEPSRIEPPPRIGTRLKTEFIRGVGKRDESFIIILDVEKVFSDEELEFVQGMTGEGSPAASLNG